MQRALASAAVVVAAYFGACLAPTAAFAQTAVQPPGPTQHQQNGISYINGGVGEEEQGAMRAVRSDYNLQLIFATNQTGAFRSDVQLAIADARGNNLVSVGDAGPMFFAKLPAGTYRISASAEGKTFKRTVRLGNNGAKEMTLHWENDSPDDPGVQD